MASMVGPFRRIRLVYRRSSRFIKCLVIAALVVGTVTLLALSVGIAVSRANTETMRQEAADLEQQNASLTEYIKNFGSVQSIQDLAKKFLGLVDPDTILFSPEE